MLEDMHWALSCLLIVVALLTMFAMGVPIGFAMGLVGLGGLLLTDGFEYVIDVAASVTYQKVTPYIFVTLPCFILMTEIMAHGGISNKLVEMAHKTMGRFPGSLAVVTIIASTIFGAISGAAAIGALTVSDMLLPECMKRNYDKSLISGAIAAGGTLSIVIPPSFMFILWAIIADVSIGEQFMAGVIPGIIIAILFIIYIVVRAKRNPALAPSPSVTLSNKEKVVALLKGWQVGLIIFVVIYGVYSGVATVTEVSGVAAATAFILALVHRSLSISGIYHSLKRTAEMLAFFVMLIVGAYLLIHLMGYLEIPQNIAEWVIDHKLSAIQLVIVTQVIFFILGMFIDAGSVMLITLPLFLPSLNELEVDLIWLGVIIGISCMIANITPPVGLNLFIIQGVGKSHGITLEHIIRGVIPFILIMVLGMIIVFAIPSLATWLPSTMN